jgi:hypothetical protein
MSSGIATARRRWHANEARALPPAHPHLIGAPPQAPLAVIARAPSEGYTSAVMVSMSGGGGGAALGSPAGILVLLLVIAVVGGIYWFINR